MYAKYSTVFVCKRAYTALAILQTMAEIYKQLCRINAEWDQGKFNVLKGLRLLSAGIQGSDLLPGDVSMETLQSLAVAMYNNKRTYKENIDSLRNDNFQNEHSMMLTQETLTFMAPKESSLMDAGHIFSNLVDLKQPHAHLPHKTQPLFIETQTTSERMHNQLIIDQTVRINGSIHKRTPCCKGRPGDGYVGCVLYQIDTLINGSLGVYLSKEEVSAFTQTGKMPADASSRVCILCYSQMLTCRSALFGTQGIGNTMYSEQTMYYQDLVNTEGGFASKFMILPGSDGLFPPAPFLAFHPRRLQISVRGNNLYVDESAMWFRANAPNFQ